MPSSNLAFFFGPGLPLTLGGASGPRATAELLLTPFFFTPSDGGGIEELGVSTAAGVLEADSDGFPPCELAATAKVSDVVGEETSFTGDSSFTMGSDQNLARFLGDSLSVTSSGILEDLRRTKEAMAGCFADAMAMGRRGGDGEGDGRRWLMEVKEKEVVVPVAGDRRCCWPGLGCREETHTGRERAARCVRG